MHARRIGNNLLRANPICRNVEFFLIDRFRLVSARELADELACGVHNFDPNFTGTGPKKVIEYRAIRRILARRLFGREWRIGVVVPTHAVSGLGSKEMGIRAHYFGIDLPKRRDVIEYPERSPMRADDDVIPVNNQVSNGSCRKIQP